MGSILLAVETVRSNATEVLDAAVAMAVSYERDFPGTPELIAITHGRIRQRSEINAFFVAVYHCITLGAERQTSSLPTEYIIGSWVCFFNGLHVGSYGSDLTASTLMCGKPCRWSPTRRPALPSMSRMAAPLRRMATTATRKHCGGKKPRSGERKARSGGRRGLQERRTVAEIALRETETQRPRAPAPSAARACIFHAPRR